MTTQDILCIRLQNQQLVKQKFTKPAEVVSWFGAMQSQDFSGAKWAVGQRMTSSTEAVISEAYAKGEILRTHVMRPTWHFVSPHDIRWMLMLTKPQVEKVMSSYNKILELTPEVFAKAQNVIRKHLEKHGQATRQVLKKDLDAVGITSNVQRLAHVVMQAELDGLICSGPMQGKQFTYMLLDQRAVPAKKLDRDEALEKLTRTYVQSHGPVTIQDFMWWSGLKSVDAKRGLDMLGKQLLHMDVDGIAYMYFESNIPSMPDKTYLLPNYDEYGIAYKERSAFFNPAYSQFADARGNTIFQHLIVRHGKMVGSWRRILKKNSVGVETNFFTKQSSGEKHAFAQAIEDYAKFLGVAVTLA